MSETAKEWVLREVQERTEPEPDGNQNVHGKVFTGRRRLVGNKDKEGRPSRAETKAAIDELVDDGQLLVWHGLLCPTTTEHLRAVIENERLADIPRKLLIAKANRNLHGGG